MDIGESVIYDGAGTDEAHVFHVSKKQRNDSNEYFRELANTERENLGTFRQANDDNLYGGSIYPGKSKPSLSQSAKFGPVTHGSGNYSRNIDRTIAESSRIQNTTNGAITENNIGHIRMERLTERPAEYDVDSFYHETDAAPQWTHMMFKPSFTDNYLRQKWPRISLRSLRHRPSDPLAVNDGDILTDKEHKDKTERTQKTVCCVVVGFLLITLVTLPAVILIVMATDTSQDSTDIYEVNMELAVDQNFTSDHNDTESTVYQSFSSKFCSEIDTVYSNTASGFGDGYKGCVVNSLREGSIIVVFTLYITVVNQAQVDTSDTKLIVVVQTNNNYLGTFLVITASIQVTSSRRVQSVPVTTTPSQQVTTSDITSTEAITSSIFLSTTESDSLSTTSRTKITTTDADTTTTDADTTTTAVLDTTTSTKKADTTKSTTLADTTSTTLVDTTSTTITDTTSTTATDATSTAVADSKSTTLADTTSTTLADTTSTTLADTTSTTLADTTSTTVADTLSTTVADATLTATADLTSTTEPDTTSTTVSDTTSTTVTDATSTAVPDSTSTALADTTSTTLADTTSTAVVTLTDTTSTVVVETRSTAATDATSTTVTDSTTTTVPDSTSSTLADTTSSTLPDTTTSMTDTTSTTVTDTASTTAVDTASTTVTDSTSTTVTDALSTTVTDTTSTTVTDKTQTTMTYATSTAVADTTSETVGDTTSTTVTDTTPTTVTDATSTSVTDTTLTTVTDAPSTTVADTTSETVGDTTSTTVTDASSTTVTDATPTTVTDATSTTVTDTTSTIVIDATSTTVTDATSTTLTDATSTTITDTISTTVGDATSTTVTDSTSTTLTDTTSTTVTDTTLRTVADTTLTTTADTTSTTVADTTSTTVADTTSTIVTDTSTISTTTSVLQANLSCSNVLFMIGSSAVFNCTLSGIEFTEISVANLDRTPTKLATINKNGTVTYEPQAALTVKYVPDEKVELIFSDVKCSDEGEYEITVTGESGDIKSTGNIAVHRLPETPTLSMHPDQVIDLQFYRGGSENECEAEVGYPPGNLVIEVKNSNSSTYEELPPIDISYVANTTISGDCSNKQTIKFGMNYTSAMNNGQIRCRVDSPVVSESISTEKDLLLIPRDICACNTVDSGVKRGHPTRCDVYVACVLRDYPTGVLCQSTQCRNSITGVCSANCSDAVCKEEVPQDFCTTPPPSTTTPAPSLYISCNESIAVLIYSESVSVICELNLTSTFQSINVTKVTTSEEGVAQISQNGNVQLLTDDDNIDVTFDSGEVKVTFKNVSCMDEGTYKFSLQVGEETAISQTPVSVLQKPNDPPTLTLNADQIADLGSYRSWLRHSCVGDIGYPAGTLSVEILNEGENEFSVLDFPADSTVTNTKSNCMVNRKVEFGILFTSAMNGALIRCVVKNNNFEEEFISYSQNETASLIPHNFCINNTAGRTFHQHPEDCTKFVQCEGKDTYGKNCGTGLCFGIESINACGFCNYVKCRLTTESEVTTTEPTTTTTEKSDISQIAMNCSTNSNFIGKGPAIITCSFVPSANILGVNISRTVTSSDSILGTVDSMGSLNDQSPEGIQLQFTQPDSAVISLGISNMSCADQGTYSFVAIQFNVTFSADVMLIAKAKPNRPTLELTHQTVVNTLSQTSVCKGNVGNPAGSIEVQVKRPNEANFTTYNNFQTTSTPKQLECNTEMEHTFSLAFTSEWNNSKIRCNVKNDETIEENEDYTSDEDTLILIPDDYCTGMGVPEYQPHPRGDCSYFIRCVNGIIYSNKCPSTLLFNADKDLCDHSFNVNATTCNFS